MIRLLNLLAIAGLVASAVYAYSIKYDTLYQAGQVSKVQTALHKERQAIAVLRAEWQLLTRPDRLQAAVEKHLALEPIGISHLGRIADGGFGTAEMCFMAISTGVSPVKGTAPVSISLSTTPTE